MKVFKSIYFRNYAIIVLVIVALLRLMLWPVRVINQGLKQSSRLMLRHYR